MKSVVLKTNKIGSSPWVFRGMVRKPDRSLEPGEMVEVLDPENRFIGHAFYNPHSQIALRLLHRGGRREMGASFFREKIKAATYLRRKVLDLDRTGNAWRLIHSEGDGLPGLIVDRLGKYLVAEIHSAGFYRHWGEIQEILETQIRDTEVVLRVDPRIQKLEGFQAEVPEPPARTWIEENGIHYQVDFKQGHKTGFFCDQRDNRAELAGYCENRNVLDACCYTGGFSLNAAIKGKAGKVVGIDLDEKAIAVAEANASKNSAQAEFVHADAFDFLREQNRSKAHWDVVVLDPPKLATGRDQLERAETKYKDLNALGMAAVKNGGLLLTCSCSGLVSEEMFLAILRKSAARVGRQLQFLKVTGAGADHPIMPNFPESRYLKAVFCSVRDL